MDKLLWIAPFHDKIKEDEKSNSLAIANTTAVTTAIIFVVCRVGIGLFPDISFTLAQSWFHGIELTKLETSGSFVLGFVSATVGAWLVGYLFASLYNFFLKK